VAQQSALTLESLINYRGANVAVKNVQKPRVCGLFTKVRQFYGTKVSCPTISVEDTIPSTKHPQLAAVLEQLLSSSSLSFLVTLRKLMLVIVMAP
jgi:hypothetical protein